MGLRKVLSLVPWGCFSFQETTYCETGQVPAVCPGINARAGAGHRFIPAEAGAGQILVLLLTVIINEVHEQSLLGPGTGDPSTLCQLIVVFQCKPLMYMDI